MVGFAPDGTGGRDTVPPFLYGVAGAASGAGTRVLSQPFDVLKIRLQLQEEPITAASKRSKYHSLRQAVSVIRRDEGKAAFWKGHVPAQALSLVFGVVQFSAFELLTKAVWYTLPSKFTLELRPLTHLVCGGLAGGLATVAAQPLDTLRTRLCAQGEPKTYHSLRDAASTMWRQEGFLSLYKGLTPTLALSASQAALQFAFYSQFTIIWNKHVGKKKLEKTGNFESAFCGGGAGICAKLIVYPLDVVKKRLQVQGFDKGRSQFGSTGSYRGIIDCLTKIVEKESYLGLYKGLSASLLKAAVSSSASFFIYETCCNALILAYTTGPR